MVSLLYIIKLLNFCVYLTVEIIKTAHEETIFLPDKSASSFIILASAVTELQKLPKRPQSLRINHRDPAQRQLENYPETKTGLPQSLLRFDPRTVHRRISDLFVEFVDVFL